MPKSRPEESLQRSVVELLAWAAPADLVWWASTNQKGSRPIWEQQLLLAMGLKAGVGDLCFVLPPMGRFACIELKVGYNKPSPCQLDFACSVERAGGLWACCWSLDEVTATLLGWGVLLRLAA